LMNGAKASVAESDHWSDAELLKRVKDGRAAVEELLLRHKGLIVKNVKRVLYDKDEILDAIQAASMKAARALHDCDGNVTSWLGTIATNEARNIVRARTDAGREPLHADSLAARDPEPIEQLVNDEDRSWTARRIGFLIDCVYAVVERLPEKQKRAFLLRYVDRLSPKEIADKLQTSIKAIYSWQNRAKSSIGKGLTKAILRYMDEAA